MNFLKPFLCATFALFAITLSAQTQSEISEHSQTQIDRLTTELSLTTDQVEQVQMLTTKVDQKIQVIRDNAEWDDQKKQVFIQGNKDDYKRAMQSILTAEQFAKYETLLTTKTKASTITE